MNDKITITFTGLRDCCPELTDEEFSEFCAVLIDKERQEQALKMQPPEPESGFSVVHDSRKQYESEK